MKTLENVTYVQSANSLFHFMKEPQYLYWALENKGLAPRYCEEKIKYLNIGFDRIYVLQKCFCDIQLHQLFEKFPLRLENESVELSQQQYNELRDSNNHVELYGKYGLAFSKEWCENNNFQPIHYLNTKSSYVKEFQDTFRYAINQENLSDEIYLDILGRLSYFKPLAGEMTRRIDGIVVPIIKNFHDEREWRYIPKRCELEDMKLERILYNSNLVQNVDTINDNLQTSDYRKIWIKFDYEDIEYIIVPDNMARLNLINYIMKKIPDNSFKDSDLVDNQRYVMISKILVLDEIRKDW